MYAGVWSCVLDCYLGRGTYDRGNESIFSWSFRSLYLRTGQRCGRALNIEYGPFHELAHKKIQEPGRSKIWFSVCPLNAIKLRKFVFACRGILPVLCGYLIVRIPFAHVSPSPLAYRWDCWILPQNPTFVMMYFAQVPPETVRITFNLIIAISPEVCCRDVEWIEVR